jgi:hypothetical protein
MMTYRQDYKKGIPKTGAVASIVAGGLGAAQNLYILTVGRTCKIRKLHILNGQGAPVLVSVGVGLAPLVPLMPPFYAVNGIDLTVREEDIQDVEFVANITVASSAAGAAPANVQVQATVEEFQGPTG